MSDFHPSGVITTFHNLRTQSIEQQEQEIRRFAKKSPISLILPSLYSELKNDALVNIVNTLSEMDYIDHIIIGLDQANLKEFKHALQFFSPLPQNVKLLWNDGPRLRKIDNELKKFNLSPKQPGKGRNVWYMFGFALAQNNIKSAFIGKVGKDEVGNSFIRGLEKEKVVFANQAQSDESETGRCLVMVTPDAQRTMSTYLGISQKLKSNDINEDVIAQSKITYLEGYLWDLDDAQEAIKKAIKISKEANRLVAFSVSDVFCIERFRESFLNLVNNEADIIFANEEEIKSLYQKDSLDDCLEIISQHDKIFAVTLGEKGAMIVHKDQCVNIKAQQIENLVDTTGAGDLFAAGFLLGYINGENLEQCGNEGVIFASKIIQIYGARL